MSELISLLFVSFSRLRGFSQYIQVHEWESHQLLEIILSLENSLLYLQQLPNKVDEWKIDLEQIYDLLEESEGVFAKYAPENDNFKNQDCPQKSFQTKEVYNKFLPLTIIMHLKLFGQANECDQADLISKISRKKNVEIPTFDRKKEFLGEGSYGKVYKGRWSTFEVAVKVVIKDKEKAESQIKEADLQQSFNHKNIVSVYEVFDTINEEIEEIWFVSELANFGDLSNLVHDRKDIELPLNVMLSMLLDISNGMAYLHSREPIVLHRDLKTLNLLIFQDCKIKITDFGLARNLSSKSVTQSSNQVGTLMWTAPEILFAETNSGSDSEEEAEKNTNLKFLYSKQSDVYSVGIIIYEMLNRSFPFEDSIKMYQALAKNKRPKVTLRIQNNQEYKSIMKLMTQCWHQDRAERPLFPQISSILKSIITYENFNQQIIRILASLRRMSTDDYRNSLSEGKKSERNILNVKSYVDHYRKSLEEEKKQAELERFRKEERTSFISTDLINFKKYHNI
jgi:serine/threonine protein kinase